MPIGRLSKLMYFNGVLAKGIIFSTLIIFALAAVSEPAFAGNPYNYTWAVAGVGEGYITPTKMAVDENNNIYIVGRFNGSYELGSIPLDKWDGDNQSGNNAFVAKLDADGEWVWANRIGTDKGSNIDIGNIVVDSQGNSFIVGEFWGSVRFGSIKLEADDGMEIFIAKLDRDGNWIWIQNAAKGTHAFGIAMDQQNNIYIAGSFDGTANFGEDVLTTDNGPSILVAKLDSDGNWLWARDAGGSGDYSEDSATRIVLGPNDTFFLSGRFMNLPGHFGNIIVELETSNSQGFISFVACLDTDGNWLWVEPYHSIGGYTDTIAVDQNGNCYIAGGFNHIELGDQIYSSSSESDVYIAILESRDKWGKFIKSDLGDQEKSGYDYLSGLMVDKKGDAYLAGRNARNTRFGQTVLENKGSFIAKWDVAENEWDWVKLAGGDVYATAMDTRNQLYIAGNFASDAVFDDIILENRHGAQNLFVAKAVEIDDSEPLPVGFPYFTFNKWSAEPAVASNHTFQVKFSLPVSPAVLENKVSPAIYVRTAQNEVVPTTLQFAGEEQNIIQVVPSNSYRPGATYYLYIDAARISSSSATGAKQLPQTIVMKFTT